MSAVSLSQTYRQVLAQPSDVQGHLETFVGLVEALDAQRICELGVRGGVSTIAWLEGVRRTGGHLYAIDLEPSPLDHAQLTFIRGDDCSPEVADQVPDQLDLVFVDSSHLYSHTVREIEIYAEKLGPGGAILFHDVDVESFDHHPEGEPPFPVRKAVEEAAFERGWDVDWRTGSYGLAVAWPRMEAT